MEHTSGPWIFTETGEANHYFVMAPDKRWLMAIQQNGELSLVEQRANMRLVCTVNELIKTNIENLKFLEWVLEQDFNMWSDKRSILYKLIAETKSSIKKATE